MKGAHYESPVHVCSGHSKRSSIQTYKAAATTQKTYQLTNSGINQNSKTVEYAKQDPYDVFEDNDADGRFGEREAQLPFLVPSRRQTERSSVFLPEKESGDAAKARISKPGGETNGR